MRRIAGLIKANIPFKFNGSKIIPLGDNRLRGQLPRRTRRASISDPASAIRDYFREFARKITDFENKYGMHDDYYTRFIDNALDKAIDDLDVIDMPANHIEYQIDDSWYNESDPIIFFLEIRIRYDTDSKTIINRLGAGWQYGMNGWYSPNSTGRMSEPGFPTYSFLLDARSENAFPEAIITVEICYAEDGTEFAYFDNDEYDY